MSKSTPSNAEMLESGLCVTERGLPLFPCAERGKTPLIRDWANRASRDRDVIRRWAQEHPGCNWATPCGPISGIWALDVDGDQGLAALVKFEKQGHCLSSTLTDRTGRPGSAHFIYKYPSDGTEVRNSVRKIAPGLDVRGLGGYIITPGSTHPNGTPYEFIDETAPIVESPKWLLAMVTNQPQRPTIPPSEIGILHQGRRNDGLARLAGAMRRRNFTSEDIETTLLAHNARRCRPPLPEREVRGIAASILRYPPGGLDPLESAWQDTDEAAYISQFEKFVALCRNLHLARPGQSIALPLERIGVLMGCDWTQVRRWRRRAVTEARLQLVGHYVPHRKAAQYLFTECPTRADSSEKENDVPLGGVPLSPTTNGLVGQSLVVQSQEEQGTGNSNKPDSKTTEPAPLTQDSLRCYVHGRRATWWQRTGGDWICELYHPPIIPSKVTDENSFR